MSSKGKECKDASKVDAGALARSDNVEALLQLLEETEKGMEERDGSGKTLLMHAAKAGAILVVKMLCERGASVDAIEASTGRNVLHMSVAQNQYQVVYALMNHLAARRQAGDVAAVCAILAAKDAQGFDALMLAIKADRAELVQLLVQHIPVSQEVACSTLIKSEKMKAVLHASLLQQSSACSSHTATSSHRAVAFRLAKGSFVDCSKGRCIRSGYHEAAAAADAREVVLKCNRSKSVLEQELAMLLVLGGGGAHAHIIHFAAAEVVHLEPDWFALALEKGQIDLHLACIDLKAATQARGSKTEDDEEAGGGAEQTRFQLAVTKQMCLVVMHIHECGFVWFDIKPSNFVCFFAAGEEEGGGGGESIIIKAIDLGGCKRIGSSVSIEDIAFTAKYAAPEVARHALASSSASSSSSSILQVHPSADYWSLGISLCAIQDPSYMLPAFIESAAATAKDTLVVLAQLSSSPEASSSWIADLLALSPSDRRLSPPAF